MSKFDEIKQRAEKATPGPWEFMWLYERPHVKSDMQGNPFSNDEGIANNGIPVLISSAGHGGMDSFIDCDQADVEFIASARTDIPLLLKALELASRDINLAGGVIVKNNPPDYWLELAQKEMEKANV